MEKQKRTKNILHDLCNRYSKIQMRQDALDSLELLEETLQTCSGDKTLEKCLRVVCTRSVDQAGLEPYKRIKHKERFDHCDDVT